MANTSAHICAINRADDGTYTTGSAAVSLPITNLKDRQPTKVWRSTVLTPPTVTPDTYRDTGANKTWFEIDLGAEKIVSVAALLAHNLTQDGKIRVRLSKSSVFATTEYDSGLISPWPSVGGYGSLPWGLWSWGDVLGAAEAAFYTISSYFILPAAVTARYVRVDIIDSTNPDGYVEAGRFWCGPSWQPSQNIQFGWELGFIDSSQVQYSLGGQAYIDEKAKRRVAKFTLAHLSDTEMYSNAFDFIDRRKGIAGDLIVIPQPDRSDLFIHEVIYGRMQSLQPITHPDYSGRTKTFILEEII